jgi:hypothetical protein
MNGNRINYMFLNCSARGIDGMKLAHNIYSGQQESFPVATKLIADCLINFWPTLCSPEWCTFCTSPLSAHFFFSQREWLTAGIICLGTACVVRRASCTGSILTRLDQSSNGCIPGPQNDASSSSEGWLMRLL